MDYLKQQTSPPPQVELSVQGQRPHWRVAGSQHWPPRQSALLLQQFERHWFATQHWPARQSPSAQQAGEVMQRPRQQRPPGPHSLSTAQGQLFSHWRVIALQHCPARQSPALRQQLARQAPCEQHWPPRQSPSPQQRARTHFPAQHLRPPPPQSASFAQGQLAAAQAPVAGSQHWPPRQSALLRQQFLTQRLLLQHWPPRQSPSAQQSPGRQRRTGARSGAGARSDAGARSEVFGKSAGAARSAGGATPPSARTGKLGLDGQPARVSASASAQETPSA